MIVPLLLLLINVSIIAYTWFSTGSIIKMDSSLTGGVSFTFIVDESLNTDLLETKLVNELGTTDLSVSILKSQLTGTIAGYEVKTEEGITKEEIQGVVEDFLSENLVEEDISFVTQSSSLGTSFLEESKWLFLVSFILMSLVSFYYFKNIVPAFSITLSTILDVIGIIAVLNLLGISMSTATIGALLMMIGYSTDSDILLAINILKKDDSDLKSRLKKALKTELTMDLAAFVTFSIMFFVSNVALIKHIALVLIIGIFFDIIDTLFGNAAFQRIYKERSRKS